MTHLTSTLSDPLSQFQQFNWSLNIFSDSDALPTAKTAGSSALQALTYSEPDTVALSPIGSQCYSNQSSLSTQSSNPSVAQVGGSAQLRQSPPNALHQRPAEAPAESDSERHNALPASAPAISHPTTLDSLQKTLVRYSPRDFFRHRNSSTLELNLPSSLPSLSPNVPNPPLTISRSHSIAHSSAATSQEHPAQPLPRSPTTLWMGDLESWMDEDYVRRCLAMTGWNLPHFPMTSPSGIKTDVGPKGVNVKIKMITGASPSSAYCFLTYPTAEMAEHAWRMISSMPPTLMPGCERTFKLNWATGLPGVQPTWDREFSVFIRDLERDVTEGELVALFTCRFPSTKSAKIMGDLSTGLSRGYAFIRFGEESDMHRALALGRSRNGTGLFLRGRCIKITQASGSSGTAGDQYHHRISMSAPGAPKSRPNPFAVNSDHSDNHFKPASTARTMANSVSNDPSKPGLRHRPEGISHGVPNGLSASASSLRSSSSYPPPVPVVPLSRLSVNDTLNANFRPKPDGLSELLSSMSALRLPPSYPSHSTAAKSAHIHPVPENPTSFARAFPTCSSMMDRKHSLPTQTLFPARPPPLTHSASLPNGYMGPGSLFATSAEANLSQFNPPFHRLHSSYDAPTSAVDSIASPNSINSHLAALTQIASVANDASNDPSNTTVFVGGLPACISEGTLKTFFQNFGEITYVKIPLNKGCGFVQYARREDAQQAMLKMHDFPIHGKSRIRLSWGRSLGDKQVEYVKKLSSSLGISFESVWKMVQGQDPSMMKQIASALSTGNGSLPTLTPPVPVRQNLPASRDPEQLALPAALNGGMAGVSHQPNFLHRLPNGQSISFPSEFSPPHGSPAGHRGSWQGFLPNPKTGAAMSLGPLNPNGASEPPAAALRACRATIHPPTPPSFPYESIPTTQPHVFRPFDKSWVLHFN